MVPALGKRKLPAMPVRVRLKKLQRNRHFIREWREHRGLTQEQLAERIGASGATVSRIEKGAAPYTQDALEAIAYALQCEVVDLLIRNPADREAPWSLFETLKPAQKRQAVEVIKAIKKADEEAA